MGNGVTQDEVDSVVGSFFRLQAFVLSSWWDRFKRHSELDHVHCKRQAFQRYFERGLCIPSVEAWEGCPRMTKHFRKYSV